MTRISIEFNHKWQTQWFIHFKTEWKWKPSWAVFDVDHRLMKDKCFGFIAIETQASTKDEEKYYEQ